MLFYTLPLLLPSQKKKKNFKYEYCKLDLPKSDKKSKAYPEGHKVIIISPLLLDLFCFYTRSVCLDQNENSFFCKNITFSKMRLKQIC